MGFYSGTLQKGSQGEETKKWQNFLKSKGYDLEVDGIFGDITTNYTKDWQSKNGLDADGIVGELTWGKAGFSNVSTPVSAPTAKPMPTAPTYDTTKWDDTQKGKDALGAYNSAKDNVNNYGPFQYANMEQFQSIMDQILNREKFSYDFNGDALYQQYKDKYIKQGKMAMGDAIGQASAMTGGYGNSYAQSVGQQAYQAQLENLNDIIPELYQMALDKYNMEGQELLNQYGVMSEDYNRAYGEYQDGYEKLMDALGIAKSDYYDGADMFHTEQSNKNTVAGKEFDDAMSIWENETTQAWKEAEWAEGQRQYEIDQDWKAKEYALAEKEYNAKYGNSSSGGSSGGGSSSGGGYTGSGSGSGKGSGSGNGGGTTTTSGTSTVSDSIKKNVQNYSTSKGQADYLAGQVNAGKITQDQAMQLLDEYGVVDLVDRSWEVVDDGGINWFGVGIDANAKVKDQFGKTYTLAELRKELKKTMSSKEANDYIKALQKRLGI